MVRSAASEMLSTVALTWIAGPGAVSLTGVTSIVQAPTPPAELTVALPMSEDNQATLRVVQSRMMQESESGKAWKRPSGGFGVDVVIMPLDGATWTPLMTQAVAPVLKVVT